RRSRSGMRSWATRSPRSRSAPTSHVSCRARTSCSAAARSAAGSESRGSSHAASAELVRRSRVLREIERVREHATRIPFRQQSPASRYIQGQVREKYPLPGVRREGPRETCGASLLLLNERPHATFVGGERGGVIAATPSQLASQDVCAKHCEGRTS